jgi:phosphate transport system protein
MEQMTSHYEESLQRDIGRIRVKVTEMGGLVDLALKGCLEALKDKNRQLAYSVILRDQRIDELENEIDRLCIEFLLRQQPVAGHLRFAYATIKINLELERVGDYAESIARQILVLGELEAPVPHALFTEIGELAISMLHDAVGAFVNGDAGLARKTIEVEDSVDMLRHKTASELVRMRSEELIPLEALTPLINIVNRFERVADQAKAICQHALYMVTGEHALHQGAEAYRLLFVDEHNHCRSQMAEAIGNALDQPKFLFSSAGLDRWPVDPNAVRFLDEKGIDMSRQASKSIQQVPHLAHYQIIVALAPAAHKVFPPPPIKTVCLDWSVRDPSTVQGSPEQVRAAYEQTYQFLKAHITDLVQAILGDEVARRRDQP